MVTRFITTTCIIFTFCLSASSAWAKEDPLDFWAFQPVKDVPAPKVNNSEWIQNPIDAFILHGLEEAGLSPADPASKSVLIRRAYYDLTGLPPTAEEIQAFIADDSPDAYEKVLDKLLASTQYGERWARHWLDLVRYADSNGYERDSNKPFMWRYRDYVIDAFNKDKPYDQFIKEQLAGDEMKQPNTEAMTATGYYRVGTWDDEPADPAQNKFDELDDIVRTTSEVFLGLTIGCARCHDHKIDPITQKDYYRFLSFFHNIKPLRRTDDFGILRPIMDEASQAAYDQAVAKNRAEEATLLENQRALLKLFATKAYPDNPRWFGGKKPSPSHLTQLKYHFYRDTWDTLPEFEMVKIEESGDLKHNYITVAPASRQSAIGFVYEANLQVPEDGEYTFTVNATDGFRIKVANLSAVESTGLGTVEKSGSLKLKKGLHPFRMEYFTKAGPPKLDVRWNGPGIDNIPLSIGTNQPVEINDSLMKLVDKYGKDYLNTRQIKRIKELEKQIQEVRKRKAPMKQAAAVSELGPKAPDTFLMVRGNPHTPGDKVEPGFPGLLNPPEVVIPKGDPAANTTYRRTALANWIASPENPMTAKVIMNRLWQHHMGRGIVRTTSDLGILGDRPTHPELLDWLASDLIKEGWKLKAMHKKIMLSSTYKMASTGNEKGLAEDPANDRFWRYNMRRLNAEEVRDSMLMASGNLNLKSHGPTIFPKLPDEVLATSSKKAEIVRSGIWGISTPEEGNRRSIYIHLKRSLIHPMLTTFDFADIDNTCPVRFVTTQPSQALGLLNSDFAHLQAEGLKARVQKEHAHDLDKQLARAFELCTGRLPTDRERDMSHTFVREMQAQNNLSLDQAFERYCLLALNLNEFLYLD